MLDVVTRPKARQDLKDIWLYSCKQWNEAQADEYLGALDTGIAKLRTNPSLGRPREDVRSGYRSRPEIANVSIQWLWLIFDGKEHFLPFDDFPWLRDAPVGSIFNVEQPHPGHLYWPDLDVDLGIATIKSPQDFPLVAG
jgi:plasmid stabilization system protein ParE